MKIKRGKGFTLIELLVVVAIIGILASVVLASLNSARKKGRDAKRARDMHEIVTALNFYVDKYGCLPGTFGSSCPAGAGSTYSDANLGGWDYSSQPVGSPTFMAFLQNSGFLSKVPLDPINDLDIDSAASPSAKFSYKYYCYNGPTWYGPHLGYWRESDGLYVFVIPQGGNFSTNPTDSSITCR